MWLRTEFGKTCVSRHCLLCFISNCFEPKYGDSNGYVTFLNNIPGTGSEKSDVYIINVNMNVSYSVKSCPRGLLCNHLFREPGNEANWLISEM